MARPTNTFSSYESIGMREDLTDAIYNISPTETPFLTKAGRGKAAHTLHEWQTDSLAAGADNKKIDADDATGDAATPTVRLGNYTQIAGKTCVVSGTLQAVTAAGRKDEMAYQISKKTVELKRDMETTLVGTNKAKAAGNSTTARDLAPVLSWIKTNTSKGTGAAADPTAADGTSLRTDGTQRALTEDSLKTVLGSIWAAGGNPTIAMVNSFNKQQLSSFTGNSTRIDQAEDKRVVSAVDVYVSDFGELRAVPNRFMRTRDMLVLDMKFWKVCYLRPFKQWELAKTGDSNKWQIITEYTLEACNEAASGGIFDLTTA